MDSKAILTWLAASTCNPLLPAFSPEGSRMFTRMGSVSMGVTGPFAALAVCRLG